MKTNPKISSMSVNLVVFQLCFTKQNRFEFYINTEKPKSDICRKNVAHENKFSLLVFLENFLMGDWVPIWVIFSSVIISITPYSILIMFISKFKPSTIFQTTKDRNLIIESETWKIESQSSWNIEYFVKKIYEYFLKYHRSHVNLEEKSAEVL